VYSLSVYDWAIICFMELGGRIEPFGNLHLAWS
jgi:hypothetical protein